MFLHVCAPDQPDSSPAFRPVHLATPQDSTSCLTAALLPIRVCAPELLAVPSPMRVRSRRACAALSPMHLCAAEELAAHNPPFECAAEELAAHNPLRVATHNPPSSPTVCLVHPSFSLQEGTLGHPVSVLCGHATAVPRIQFSPLLPWVLLSCSQDGTCRCVHL